MDISISDLWFSFPGKIDAIRGISLKILAGEQVAIVGQNGAGKTTLVKHLNGLLKPTKGEVLIGGWNTSEHTTAELASRVGYVFQNPDQQLFSSTVYDEVAFGPKNLGFDEGRIESLVEDALVLTQLTEYKQTNPYELSAPWRKLIAVASILSMDTDIVILDEPTTGQDGANIERFAHIVKTLKDRKKTVITITHDIDFCAENFERIITLAQGRVLLDGRVEDVIFEEEILAMAYVDPPQIARLSKLVGLSSQAYTSEVFICALKKDLEEKTSVPAKEKLL